MPCAATDLINTLPNGGWAADVEPNHRHPSVSSRSRRDVPKIRAPPAANNRAVASPIPAPVTNIVRSDGARGDMASPQCRVRLVSWPQAHHRQLAHQALSRSLSAVVPPSDQRAEESAHDRPHPVVASFVVRDHRRRFCFVEHTVSRRKTAAADDDLDGRVGLDIAVPVRRRAESGDDHGLPGRWFCADDLEHGAVSAARFRPTWVKQRKRGPSSQPNPLSYK